MPPTTPRQRRRRAGAAGGGHGRPRRYPCGGGGRCLRRRRRSREGRTYSKSVSNDPATDHDRDQGARLRRRRVAVAGHRGDEAAGPARARRRRSRRAGGGAGRPAAPGPPRDVRRRARPGRRTTRRSAGAPSTPPPRCGGKGSRSVLPAAAHRRPRATPTRWSWWAPPGSSASAATARPWPRWPHVAAATPTPAAARRRSPRSAPSATRPGCRPCSAALDDKPTVRRRATVALAGFDDPAVEPALRRAAGRPRLAGPPGGRGAARRALARRPTAAGGRQSSCGEEPAQLVEGLEAEAGPEHHALERRVDQVHRHRGGVGQALAHAPQQRAPADQVDALEDDVLGQLGRRLAPGSWRPPRSTEATLSSSGAAHLERARARPSWAGPVATSRPRISACCSPS